MRRKIKIFFEDIGMILIVGVLIYGGYSLFFTKSSQDEKQTTQKTKEDTKIVSKQEEPKIAQKEESNKVVAPKIEPKQEEPKKELKPLKIAQEKIKTQEKKEQKKTSNTTISKVNIKVLGKFLFDLKSQINRDLESQKNKYKTDTVQTTKIRVTILKDGYYEQLTFVDGNREFYEDSRDTIKSIFPLKIDERIIGQFPRYFRMSIKH
jgi:hypothetical protein